MPDVQKNIREWLHQQQDWLQEAAEKLLVSGSLADADIQSIAERLKTTSGQRATNARNFDRLAGASGSSAELRLVAIGDISGIENLSPRNPLSFGAGNLTVIYGHNGSGKSGYTRILKKACGKPRATELKPNVFQAAPTTRQCKITYKLAGTDLPVDWPANGDPIGDLRAVDIFDADAATFYLSRETEVSYTPPPVALFEALASVCDRVKARLQAEQNLLVSKLPVLPPEYVATAPGVAYKALKFDLAEAAILRLTQWGEDDQTALERLTTRLKADDPAALARKKRNTKGQLDQLSAQLQGAASAVSAEGLEAIRNARKEAQSKRKIATEYAQVNTKSAKLDGIGTDTWNALWQAARAYSQTVYPEQEYPVTQDSARCVLCHQELKPDAQQRLRDFEDFVQGVVEAEARVAEAAYKTVLDSLPAIPTEQDIRTRCEAAGLTEESWLKSLVGFWGKVGEACESLRDGEAKERAIAVDSPDDLLTTLKQRVEALEREAIQNDADATNFDREKASKDKLSLEARRWTAQQAAAIREEIDRLKQVAAYEGWTRLANSRNISLKAGELAEKVVTQAYMDRFNRELKALGAARIKVELIKTRTERGKALHQLRLKGVATGQAVPESVLSEGERRIVALAAFLADVAEKPHAAPFIFDDPISSLDQDFEWHVATRLAKLAQSRQVLVFTHRLSLYGAMEDAAKKIGDDWKQQHLQQSCIESFSGVAGHPADEAVWNANTKKANNMLLTRLDDAKKAGETGGASAYRNLAQGICTEFRKLLERTVEDDLLNQVLRRHRRSVTTDNRLAPLPHISPEDCKFIDDLMTKYSCYEHSQSQEMPSFLPEEPELRADLESLKTWRKTFKKRPEEAGA